MESARPRVILHCDMDAFYASIEQRDRPELRGKPVVVGSLGKRGVVSTASYEARRFGVRSAMPGSRARALCPHGVFLPPRMAAYAAESRRIFGIFARSTPLVEPLSLDEAFLDVTACRELLGDGPAIARSIREAVRRETGLTVSIGVATTKYVAKVASDHRKPDGLTIVEPGAEAAFLAPLPLSRLWGAGPRTVAQLERLGLRTIGDLQALAPAALRGAVGQAYAEHFLALARGCDPRSVEPDREARSIGRETTFEEDSTDDEACRRVLLELSESVGRRLRRAGARAGVVRVKVRFPPFRTLTRQEKLPSPTQDDLTIYRAAERLVGSVRRPGAAVRLLGVTACDLTPTGAPGQGLLFSGTGSAERPGLLRAIDSIRERFGEKAIRRGR